MITLDQVKDEVASIERLATVDGDYEILHSFEDRLYRRVLEAIANGTREDPAELAREALKTQTADFARCTA